MSYHGIQFSGIAIVLASLALGSLSISGNLAITISTIYAPNVGVAIIGIVVTIGGAFADPLIDRRMNQQEARRSEVGK